MLEHSRRSRAGSCSDEPGSTQPELHQPIAQPRHDYSDAAASAPPPLADGNKAQTASAEPAAPW
ncbi:MAG TPA: hypothetical protein VNB91_03810, partial [Jatrophihabitantaceae bacterium]|nr:hypothetical protein [Jatrophihabitantaceae bacterium]